VWLVDSVPPNSRITSETHGVRGHAVSSA
jgi:hypothetical protein